MYILITDVHPKQYTYLLHIYVYIYTLGGMQATGGIQWQA